MTTQITTQNLSQTYTNIAANHVSKAIFEGFKPDITVHQWWSRLNDPSPMPVYRFITRDALIIVIQNLQPEYCIYVSDFVNDCVIFRDDGGNLFSYIHSQGVENFNVDFIPNHQYRILCYPSSFPLKQQLQKIRSISHLENKEIMLKEFKRRYKQELEKSPNFLMEFNQIVKDFNQAKRQIIYDRLRYIESITNDTVKMNALLEFQQKYRDYLSKHHKVLDLYNKIYNASRQQGLQQDKVLLDRIMGKQKSLAFRKTRKAFFDAVKDGNIEQALKLRHELLHTIPKDNAEIEQILYEIQTFAIHQPSQQQRARLQENRINNLAILGLGPDATQKDIKKRYRKLAHTTHPDRGGSKEAFSRINYAYQALIDK